MRKRLLDWYARFVFERRVTILITTVVLTVLAALACLRLELRTSREDVGEVDSPASRAWHAYEEEFGAANQLLVVISPEDPDAPPPPAEYQAFVDDLAARLSGETEMFSGVFSRVDLQAFEARALHFLPLPVLQELVETLTGPDLPLRDLAGDAGLTAANELLSDRIRRGLASGSGGGGDEAEGLQQLVPALAWEGRFLADPDSALGEIDPRALIGAADPTSSGISDGGYLATHDGRHYFLVAKPASSSSDLSFINPLIARTRQLLAEVEATHPGLRGGLGGLPAMIQEEMAAVRHDTLFTTGVAVIGIAVLSLFAFHRRRLAPLVLIALIMGVIWAGALIATTIGYLNLITSSFAAILVGLGIDFGVHIVSQYEIETASGRVCADAIGASIRKVGPGLLASTFTTATAFFSITLMDFPGFAQLGFVGGWGIVLCLLATLTALPAMLAIVGSRSRPAPARGEHGDRISRGVLRYPRAVLAIGLLVSVVLGLAAWDVSFDDNIRNLLPTDAESLRLQETVLRDSELSPDFTMVLAPDLPALARLQASQPDLPYIGRRESILNYLPQDAAVREPLLERLRGALDGLRLRPARLDPAALAASLDRLEEAFAEVEDLAFADGRPELLAAAGEAAEAVRTARAQAADAPPDRAAAWQAGQTALVARANELLERLRQLAAAPAPGPEDLPAALRERLIGRNGTYLLYLYPDGNIAEPGVSAGFLRDSAEISPDVTGYPILVQQGTERITAGFDLVIAVGALLSALALLIDFRSLAYALGAAATVGIGILWMLGLMGFGEIRFNLANLPTVPLVLGAGVAYGIHVLHRYRQEGKEGLATVLHHTGRAILISALTTMIGFGSMALASHRGVSSLGTILLFGIGSCFLSATILLPCALHLLPRKPEEAG